MMKSISIHTGPSLRALASAMLCLALAAQPGAIHASTSANGASVYATTNSKLLHVVVGHTFFLNTTARLRRVYIGNPTVLGSYTSNPNEVLITAKAAGVSSLVVWDALGESTL